MGQGAAQPRSGYLSIRTRRAARFDKSREERGAPIGDDDRAGAPAQKVSHARTSDAETDLVERAFLKRQHHMQPLAVEPRTQLARQLNSIDGRLGQADAAIIGG